jgi:hypothetical protein
MLGLQTLECRKAKAKVKKEKEEGQISDLSIHRNRRQVVST